MNKESIIAIIIGLALGVLVAGVAVYTSLRSQRSTNDQITSAQPTVAPTVLPTTNTARPEILQLSITSPTSGSITENASVVIEGSVTSNALVIYQSALRQEASRVTDGKISNEFPLALGENIIQISSYGPKQAIPIKKTLHIYRVTP